MKRERDFGLKGGQSLLHPKACRLRNMSPSRLTFRQSRTSMRGRTWKWRRIPVIFPVFLHLSFHPLPRAIGVPPSFVEHTIWKHPKSKCRNRKKCPTTFSVRGSAAAKKSKPSIHPILLGTPTFVSATVTAMRLCGSAPRSELRTSFLEGEPF